MTRFWCQCKLQNNIVIDDVPKGLCYHQTSTQSLFIPGTDVKIPISFYGPIPYIHARYPSDTDLDTYEWIEITSPSDWVPYPDETHIYNYQSSLNTSSMTDYDIQRSIYYKAKETIAIYKVNSTKKDKSISP